MNFRLHFPQRFAKRCNVQCAIHNERDDTRQTARLEREEFCSPRGSTSHRLHSRVRPYRQTEWSIRLTRPCRFKGTESTFENFPSRLQHVLSESEDNLPVECVVFPAYEVNIYHIAVEGILTLQIRPKGNWLVFPPRYDTAVTLSIPPFCLQNAAVVRFADWLTMLTVQKEVANGGGAGSLKIILCGHRWASSSEYLRTTV